MRVVRVLTGAVNLTCKSSLSNLPEAQNETTTVPKTIATTNVITALM